MGHLRAGIADDVESLGQISCVSFEAQPEDHAVQTRGVPRNFHRLLEEALHLFVRPQRPKTKRTNKLSIYIGKSNY